MFAAINFGDLQHLAERSVKKLLLSNEATARFGEGLFDETPAEAFEHLALMKLSKEHYRANGTGRPTKKERREIDDFISDDDSFIGNEE